MYIYMISPIIPFLINFPEKIAKDMYRYLYKMNQTAPVFITVNNWKTSKCPIMGLVK